MLMMTAPGQVKRHGIALLPLYFALLVLPGRVAASESNASCLSAYNVDYETNWLLSRESWIGQCDARHESGDIIRRHQASFTESCVRKFLDGALKSGLNEFGVRAYCARGAAGEVLLSSRTGIALEIPTLSSGAATEALRSNAWTRIYALTRVIGDETNSRVGPDGKTHMFKSELNGSGISVVLPRYPGVETPRNSTEVCEFQSNNCPLCGKIPGFDPDKFSLAFKDIGCRGTLTAIRWTPSSGESDDYTRAWLDVKRFEQVGERQEAELREYFRHRH